MSMMRRLVVLFSSAMLLVGGGFPSHAQGQGQALVGTVTSAAEGSMEGVVVSAKRAGSTITVSVTTNESGQFAFPASRLAPGRYALSARAAGYVLEGPKAADISADATATADLRLAPTRNLSAQLTNAEWLISMPGTPAQKRFFLNCASCHAFDRIVRSTHDAEAFVKVFERMEGYYPGSTPLHPQLLPSRRDLTRGANVDAAAKFLASVNLSESETWQYPLKTLPRPKGRATRVIVTEYDLPRQTIQPHDVVLDAEGNAWYSSFGEQFLGKLDPKTGKHTEFPVPLIKPSSPTGALDLEIDRKGHLWIGMMFQGGVARFDPKTETFKMFPLPAQFQDDRTQVTMVSPEYADVDGKVWTKASQRPILFKLDPETGAVESLPIKDPQGRSMSSYGIPSDQKNNLWLLGFGGQEVGRVDAKTGLVTIYRTPTQGSRPRRGRVDEQGRLWFGEYAGNAVGMFDPVSETFKEYQLPTPWSAPYDVVVSKGGDVWTGSMLTDRVARLDPETGQFIEYLMPRPTNIRRVFVDASNTVWIGNNHGASILKVEPLD